MKHKVLILTNRIMTYRLPIFHILAQKYDLTIAYSEGSSKSEYDDIKTIFLPICKLSRFVFHKSNIKKLASEYDVVIYTGNISWIKYALLPFHRKRKYKTICWGIGVSASYSKAYDQDKKWDGVRDFFYSKADAMLFYSEYPVEKYIKRGYSPNKLFVAHNTVKVTNNIDSSDRHNIMFIGTLYKAKGIGELLEAYYNAYNKCHDIYNLNIIGAGDGYNDVANWILEHNMSKKITLLGAIYDETEKERYFKSSILCISPNQAGLGVLESMAHGTTFVTKSNSITGGERFNIIDQETGVLYNESQDLEGIIVDSYLNPNKYLEIGKKAKAHYDSNRTPEMMAKGFIDAISYVLDCE